MLLPVHLYVLDLSFEIEGDVDHLEVGVEALLVPLPLTVLTALGDVSLVDLELVDEVNVEHTPLKQHDCPGENINVRDIGSDKKNNSQSKALLKLNFDDVEAGQAKPHTDNLLKTITPSGNIEKLDKI